jgi:uncharacterized membrane protein
MTFTGRLFHPKSLVDDAYEIGIVLKAIGGVIEIISGIGLLFISPVQIHQLVTYLTQAELLEDPHDFLATHLSQWSAHLGAHATLFGAIYLLSHGVLKIGVIVALLFKQRWAYPVALVVFSGFAVYQLYVAITKGSIGYYLLTIYDAIVIYLVWLEYRKVRVSTDGGAVAKG